MTISATQAEVCELLLRDLYRHVDEVEFLATKIEPWDRRDTHAAREVIPDLVAAIRAVLHEHDVKLSGRCRICHDPWPCASVRAIKDVITDPERAVAELVERE